MFLFLLFCPNPSSFHKPLCHGKYGEAHNCRPLAFDSRDKEGAEALYGVGAGLVVAFAGGGVGAEHVFGPLREGHVGGVVKQFRPVFPVGRQPDDAAAWQGLRRGWLACRG